MKELEDFLVSFESPIVSQNMRDKLADYIEEPWFEGIFTAWINRRLREKIPLMKLLALAFNLDPGKYPELGPASAYFNNALIGNVVLRKIHYDYFYYIINHEPRNFMYSLVLRAVKHLSHGRIDDSLQTLKGIADNTHWGYYELILRFLEEKTEARSLSNMLTMTHLPVEDQYQVLAVACRSNSTIFKDLAMGLQDNNKYLFKYCVDRAEALNGQDELSQALVACNLHLSIIESCQQLTDFLIWAAEHIHPTLEHLLKRAEYEEAWTLVLKLAPAFDKKQILKILLRAQDPILIDKFFFTYKDYPEVKNLAPFL